MKAEKDGKTGILKKHVICGHPCHGTRHFRFSSALCVLCGKEELIH
jgi:hypothetical protein